MTNSDSLKICDSELWHTNHRLSTHQWQHFYISLNTHMLIKMCTTVPSTFQNAQDYDAQNNNVLQLFCMGVKRGASRLYGKAVCGVIFRVTWIMRATWDIRLHAEQLLHTGHLELLGQYM
jgi:hypothetical protein